MFFRRVFGMLSPLVICGPSGSGKSTLLNKLMSEMKESFKFCVSHTTRCPRSGESEGKEYHFVDKKTFEEMISKNLFIEFTVFSGHYYGTSKESLEVVQRSGRIAVLDLELSGVKSIKGLKDLNAKYVFIKSPDFDTLEKNLKNRGSEDPKSLEKRLSRALEDIKTVDMSSGLFDLILVNDNLEEAYHRLKSFVEKEIIKK